MFGLFFPVETRGASLEYSAWLPYWKKASGTPDALIHLNQLAEISPFAFSVNTDGSLKDVMKLSSAPWPELFSRARSQKVKIIPSILWTDRERIYQILSVKNSRQTHIANIVKVVKEGNFDGIDIDYENKKVETKIYFSAFLRELSAELKKEKKLLSCTIEARTPPDSRFLRVPAKVEYVNDYQVINRYCDRVRLMTYDQTTVDVKLNLSKRQGGVLYAPVADRDWVRKVLYLTLQTISAKKISLGVASYGYEFAIVDKGTYFDYQKLRSLSWQTATQLAKDVGAKPFRNRAGEWEFSYIKSGQQRLVVVSDAVAIADKIKIAKANGLRGISLFRLDGESDPAIWAQFK